LAQAILAQAVWLKALAQVQNPGNVPCGIHYTPRDWSRLSS